MALTMWPGGRLGSRISCSALMLIAIVLACCCWRAGAYTCIDEGGIVFVPIPKNNATYPNARICQDLTPDRNNCLPLLWSSNACQGGYYMSVDARGERTSRPCPAGFYCPANTICLVPCPMGAYCVTPRVVIDPTKTPPVQCIPDYHTEQTTNRSNPMATTCGGPASLDEYTICQKGYYCPNISTQVQCPAGSYCRSGRVTPQPCPFLSKCKPGTSAPIINGIGLVFDLFLIVGVIIIYLLQRFKHDIKAAFQLHIEPRISGKGGKYEVHKDGANVRSGPTAAGRNAEELQSISPAHAAVEVRYGTASNSEAETVSGGGVAPKSYTMDIMFRDLSLTLRGSRKKVLQGATGQLRPRTLTAIMGGSGAGKTTLLNTLSGKAYYGIVEGQVEVNGMPADITNYRSIMGFVPQEDTMHRELTAREVLYYQGILRLSSCATFSEISRKVDDVLTLLGLSDIKDSLIGDEEKRGISGGQRKRVNIGMELVADPTLLFLDEPTSGLDSVSSMQVCEALRRVAEQGHLTVVAVLHQPRYEIFQMFHEVILLQPGGTIAFQGSTQQAQEYFSQLGYPGRPNINPSDHYLDVINEHNQNAEALRARLSSTARVGADSPDGGDIASSTLGDLWSRRRSDTATDGAGLRREPSEVTFQPRKPTSFWIQMLFFLHRAFVLQWRQLGVLVLDQLLVLIAGAVLGALYSEILLRKLALLLCMTSMAVALTSMLASLRCFGNNKPVFWRESSAGINRIAYFLAINISQIPIILFTPLVFLTLFYTLVSPRSFFRDYYIAVLMLVWASHGLGYAISTIFNSRSSQMATVVLVLVSAMMSGAQPSLCKMNKLVIGPVLYSLSFGRWFVEALFEKEANRYPSVMATEVALYSSYQGYSLDNFALCIAILFVFGLVARIIALLCLMFTHRGEQK